MLKCASYGTFKFSHEVLYGWRKKRVQEEISRLPATTISISLNWSWAAKVPYKTSVATVWRPLLTSRIRNVDALSGDQVFHVARQHPEMFANQNLPVKTKLHWSGQDSSKLGIKLQQTASAGLQAVIVVAGASDTRYSASPLKGFSKKAAWLIKGAGVPLFSHWIRLDSFSTSYWNWLNSKPATDNLSIWQIHLHN